MVSTRSKTGAAPPHSPVKTITKRRHDKPSPLASSKSPKRSPSAPPVFPNLTLHDDTGAIISTHSLLTDQTPGLILFTYPRANTGGCTTQAKGLSDLQQSARNAGYNIVGCSYDSVKSQAAWKVKRSISVPLLCDTPGIGLLRKLSVHKPPRSAKRSVFVITRQHDKLAIVLAKRAVSPKDSIALMEQYIRDHPLSVQPPAANDHPMTEDDHKPQQPVASDTTKPEQEEPPVDQRMTDAPAKSDDHQPPSPPEEPAPKPQHQPEPKPAEELPPKPAEELPPKPAEDAPKPQPEKEQSSDKPQPTSAAKQPQPPSPPADKPAETAKPAEKPSEHKPKSTPEPTATDPVSDPNTKQPADTKTPEENKQSDPQPPAKATDEKPVGMDVEKPQQDTQA